MNQYTVVDENPLGDRLDSVRALLTRQDLSPWARDYWSTVEKTLTRMWRARVLGVKTYSESTTYTGFVSY